MPNNETTSQQALNRIRLLWDRNEKNAALAMANGIMANPDNVEPGLKEALQQLLQDLEIPSSPAQTEGICDDTQQHSKFYFDQALKYHQEGNIKASLESFQQARSVSPDEPEIWFNIGACLKDLKQPEQALEAVTKAVELAPDNIQFLTDKIGLLDALGKTEEADTAFRKAAQLSPLNAEIRMQMGFRAFEKGALEVAIGAFQEGLAIDPNHFLCHYNLGVALGQLDRIEESAIHHQKATMLDPASRDAWFNFGWALLHLNKFDKAEEAFRRANELRPNEKTSLYNLALALRNQGNLDEALAILADNEGLFVDYADAIYLRAQILQSLYRPIDAIHFYQQALSVKPDHPQSLENMGFLLGEQGDLEAAIAYTKKAMAISPNTEVGRGNLMYFYSYLPGFSAEEATASITDWADRYAPKVDHSTISFYNDLVPDRRLRIGYVSPDFRYHVSNRFVLPLLEGHNRDRVELFLYAQTRKEDSITDIYRSHADHWFDTSDVSDLDVVQKIREDKIDILIDLGGHTSNNRILVFGHRPAPIQITWLGYGNTSGLKEMDYFLGDENLVPKGYDHLFSEKVIRLPGTFMCYRPWTEMDEVAPLPAEKNGYVTFASMSRSVRYNNKVRALWARVLETVPNSKLMLFTSALADLPFRECIKNHFVKSGIPEDRLILDATRDWWTAYHRADIFLDSFPQNNGTTIFDSLWMGVPVITLQDRPPVGRLGTSIISHLNMDDWITDTEDAYIQKAITAASDLRDLAALRASLRQKMEQSPLRNEKQFVTDMESMYTTLWQGYCNAPRFTHSPQG